MNVEWTYCDDAMPEKEGWYLVSCAASEFTDPDGQKHEIPASVGVIWYDGEFFVLYESLLCYWKEGAAISDDNIYAWAELPAIADPQG